MSKCVHRGAAAQHNAAILYQPGRAAARENKIDALYRRITHRCAITDAVPSDENIFHRSRSRIVSGAMA
jgi:hypothetical protein